MLGLPDGVTACLFDMDGVVTKTAIVHAAAWKQMFDEFLRVWSARNGREFVPFDSGRDYDEYVDGKPRLDGTGRSWNRAGSSSRRATPADPPGTPTVRGLGNRKNELVLAGAQARRGRGYEGSRRYVDAVREAGLHDRDRLVEREHRGGAQGGGVADLFDVRVDGQVARSTSCTASRRPTPTWRRRGCSGSTPASAAVFEDALAGVAGRARRRVRVRGRRGPGRPGGRSCASTAPTWS